MARKKPTKTADDKSKRPRARDLGAVIPIGAEISTEIHQAMENCRVAKRWSKRTILEEALRRYCEQEGFWPPPSPPPE